MDHIDMRILAWITWYLKHTRWLENTEYPRNVYGGLAKLFEYVSENSDIYTEKEIKTDDQQTGT